MIRFLFRMLAAAALAGAVIFAVLDATRSIAASRLVLTPLARSWQGTLPASFEASRGFVSDRLHPQVWQVLEATVLQAPGFAVFLLLAFLLYAVGRRPQPRRERLAWGR